jgi:hypothetical protein
MGREAGGCPSALRLESGERDPVSMVLRVEAYDRGDRFPGVAEAEKVDIMGAAVRDDER